MANTNTIEKAYGIGNIKNAVPILLDLNKLNYDAWRELFYTHCVGYGVAQHLDESNDKKDDEDWVRMNSMVKSCIYGTLTNYLLNNILKKDYTAGKIWSNLEKLFRDNRDAKVIQLDNELRNLVMGDSNVTQYCSRIQTITDLLENIDAKVPEKNIVTYLLNGLSPKFATVATMIRHKTPVPDFMETRSILLLEEQQMELNSRRIGHAATLDTSSSPTVLNTSHHQRGGRGGGGRGGRGGRGRGGWNTGAGGRNFGGGRSYFQNSHAQPSVGSWVWCPWNSSQQRGILPTPVHASPMAQIQNTQPAHFAPSAQQRWTPPSAFYGLNSPQNPAAFFGQTGPTPGQFFR